MSSDQHADDLRRTATREDAAALDSLCGVTFLLEDVPALLDPRGVQFQRLEWMGDSLLDALLAQHRRTEPSCCRGIPLERLCSDTALAGRAEALKLADVLDWRPSSGRLADLVEALVGAAWLVEPSAAVQVAEVLVHAGLTLDAVFAPSTSPTGTCTALRPDAQLGSALFKAADALVLMHEMPDADEGELSAQRARDISGDALVPRARRAGLDGSCRGPRNHVLDHIQAAVGYVSATEGLLPGLKSATVVLRGRRAGPDPTI